ncbi:MAG: phosphate/phosphite/phosphonate ABC transporter substrate-binding protein [Bdellovibrionales bacterium]
MRTAIAVGLVMIAMALTSCTGSRGELGTEKNPIKLYFVPSVDAKVIEDNSKIFRTFLEKNTPYKFEVSIPQSFVAVVEAFGTKRADVAAMNTFGYALANKKYGAEARLTVLRHGSATYQAQFITRADSKIKKIEDLEGKKMAFVDPASTSGYLVPLKTLKDKNIKPKETVFAMKHDSVVSMVYQGQVDAGATFYSPPSEGKIEDARRLVKTQYPDVEEKVVIVELSKPVPNDPIVFRKDLTEDMKTNIAKAFKDFVQTPEGKKAFQEIYGVTDLKDANDGDYQATLKMYDDLGVNLNEMATGKK